MAATDAAAVLKEILKAPDAKNPVGETRPDPALARAAAAHIMAGRFSRVQVAAFLVAAKLSGMESDPPCVAAVADAMRTAALCPTFSDGTHTNLVDIVGTGGDGQNTFNVSTAASIVAAGAGCKVAKHGNRASSSSSGSADVLEALGCRIAAVSPPIVASILDKSNFCFLFSQVFHPAMRHVAGPRKELGVRTIFNLLGPLTNPARPSKVIVGVFSRDIGSIMAQALHLSGVKQGWVVHGNVGLDEISCEGTTHVWMFGPTGEITERTISAADFGLPEHPLKSVIGGDATENATTMRALLCGTLHGPILDFVLMNAGALLHVAGVARDLKDGVGLARQSIANGDAKRQLDMYIAASQDAANVADATVSDDPSI